MTALRTVVNLSLRCLNDSLWHPSMQLYNLNGELLTIYCCDLLSSSAGLDSLDFNTECRTLSTEEV